MTAPTSRSNVARHPCNIPGRLYDWAGRVLDRMGKSLLSHDGRRAWAFFALLGGSGILTGMITLILFWLRTEALYLFWLGLAAHVQLGLCLTGFMAMFVKREVEATRQGLKVKDLTVEGNVNVQPSDEQGIRGDDSGTGDSVSS